MITALLWDHDGVLVDTEGLYLKATRETLAEVGVELSDALYRQLFLIEGRGAFHLAAARGLDEAQLARLRSVRNARYSALLQRSDVLIEGALPLLRSVRARFRMAIVTSSRRDHFEIIHRGAELPALFELILAREDYEQSKPDPEPYLLAVERLGVAPASCLVIEDSERGLRAALAAGLTCWVVPSALTRESSFEGAARRFESLAELGDALLSLP